MKDKFGKIQKHQSIRIKAVKSGDGMQPDDLTPVEKNIGRVGGIPNIGEKNSHLLPPSQFKELTNYKVQPTPPSAIAKALNTVRGPAKKLNNLKFEL